jgi:hypothetical protein
MPEFRPLSHGATGEVTLALFRNRGISLPLFSLEEHHVATGKAPRHPSLKLFVFRVR